MYHLIGIGNALLDTEYHLDDDTLAKTGLARGNMSLADETAQSALLTSLANHQHAPVKQSGGGSAANSLVAFASLGGTAFYNCRVADDVAGNAYLADLADAGVDTDRNFAIADGTTGTCAVLVTPDGERTMQTHLGTSANINDENVDFERLPKAEWLYLEGYLSMSPSVLPAITRLRQQAGVHGTKIVVSFADPAVVKFAKDGLLTLLGNGVDVIFCNLEEAQIFTDKKQHKACAKALLDYAKIAVVTNGGEPTIIAQKVGDDCEILEIPAEKATVVDTNGAGDNFAGAFLYGLSQSYTLAECGKLASLVAKEVVANFGARLPKESYQAIKNQALR